MKSQIEWQDRSGNLHQKIMSTSSVRKLQNFLIQSGIENISVRSIDR